jgi:hypothetical protein
MTRDDRVDTSDIVHVEYVPIFLTQEDVDKQKLRDEGHKHVIIANTTFTPTSKELDQKITTLVTPRQNYSRFRLDNDSIQHVISALNDTKKPPSKVVTNALLGILLSRNEDRIRMLRNGRVVNANDELVTNTLGAIITSLQKKFSVSKIGREYHWVPTDINHVHSILEGSLHYSELLHTAKYICRLFHQDIVFLRRHKIINLDDADEPMWQKRRRVSILGQLMGNEWNMLAKTVLKIIKENMDIIGEVCRTLYADICECLSPEENATLDPIIISDFLLNDSVHITAKENFLAQLAPSHRKSISIAAIHASDIYKSDKPLTNFFDFTSVVLSKCRITAQHNQQLFEKEWSLFFTLMSALLSATEIEKGKHDHYVHALLAQYEMVQSCLKESSTCIEDCKDLYDLFYVMFVEILKVDMPQTIIDDKKYKEEEMSNNMTYDDEQQSEEEEEEEQNGSSKIFCICRGPEKGFMIQCSKCDEWYHGKCVKITEKMAAKIPVYVCDRCATTNSSPKKRKIKNEQDQEKPQPKRPRKRKTLTKKLSNTA